MINKKLKQALEIVTVAFENPALIYLSFLSFGIMLCFSLQLSNYSNLFKFYGTSAADLPWLWIVPPLSGMIIQPLVGQLSDDTATRFGKRKPYIFFWCLLAVAATALLSLSLTFPVALVLIWILNCSLNGGTEVVRALTGDVIKADIRPQAFALQALFAGLGGAIGASLPVLIHHLSLPNFLSSSSGPIPLNIKVSFQVAAVVLIVSTFGCLFGIKEKLIKQSFFTKHKRASTITFIKKAFKDLWKSIRLIPKDLRIICYIHALGWVGIFIFWLYFSTAIGQNLYQIPLNQAVPHLDSLKEQASLDTSYYFSVYQYVSILYTFIIYLLPSRSPLQIIHAFAMFLGGIGLFCVGFEREGYQIFLSMVAVGIMWGSIMSLPYSIAIRLLPRGKTGVYLGIFNICITLPQIICSLILKPVYTIVFQQHAGMLVSMGGFITVLCAYLWLCNDEAIRDRSGLSFSWVKKTLQEISGKLG